MQETTTLLPAFTDALYARLAAALEQDGWQCLDGPTGATSPENDQLIVGMPDADGQIATSDVQRTQGLGHRYTETYEIQCSLWSYSGDEEAKPRRDRVRDGLALVEEALKQDRGLGGVVDLTNLGPGQVWRALQNDAGAAVEVIFTIQARVTR